MAITLDLAIAGGTPLFAPPRPVGQLYYPSFERYESEMRALFDSGWYTNHGPRAQELERRLAEFYGVRHAIVVTNATIGLLMVVKAMDLKGAVIVPGFTFVATAQAVTWCGLDVVLCDVDEHTHQVTPKTVAAVLDERVEALCGVNLWGGSCDPAAIEAFSAKAGLRVYFDSAQGSGVVSGGRRLGAYGEAEVFSFHATKVISANEGGCITTNNDELAARLRNIRSSYGAGPPVEVPVTSNGRFSEAQAAIALMSLDDYPWIRERNASIVAAYDDALNEVPGIDVVLPSGAETANFSYAVVEIDEEVFGLGRDDLLALLRAEGVIARRYFHPGLHRTVPYGSAAMACSELPNTDRLSERLLQLPVGATVDADDATAIASVIAGTQGHAEEVRALLVGRS